jgi:acyl-CoA reductase-like NAD-dependent aldehyde dehydrogenase
MLAADGVEHVGHATDPKDEIGPELAEADAERCEGLVDEAKVERAELGSGEKLGLVYVEAQDFTLRRGVEQRAVVVNAEVAFKPD